MVDTLGLPTIFFTHSVADLQWPELARLTCPEDPESRSSRTTAIIEILPLLTSSSKKSKVLLLVFWMLQITGYILSGSNEVVPVFMVWHGYQMLKCSCHSLTTPMQPRNRLRSMQIALCQHGIQRFYQTKQMHQAQQLIRNQAYTEVENYEQDLANLIATCQRHTHCSAAYCLRTKNRHQQC